MHQSFETPIPTGPGNSEAFNFPVCKALPVKPAQRGHIYGKIPAKIPCDPGGVGQGGVGQGGVGLIIIKDHK